MNNFIKKYKFGSNRQLIIIAIILVSMLTTLVGCRGSKTFQGAWYAQNSDGKNLNIIFTEKKYR